MLNNIKQIYQFIQSLGLARLLKIKRSHTFARPLLRGYYVSSCIITLLESGCFEVLKTKGIDIGNDLSDTRGNAKVLQAVLEYLYCAGIIEKKGSFFSIKKEIAQEIQESAGGFLFTQAYRPLVENLTGLLTNKVAYGNEIKRIDEKVVEASAVTEDWAPYPFVEQTILENGYSKVLDVGCGSCRLLIKLCDHIEKASCVGIDCSRDSISVATAEIGRHNLQNRIKAYQGDFIQSDFSDLKSWNPDVVTFMFVLHEILSMKNPEELSLMLKKLALKFPKVHLLVCELTKQPPDLLKRRKSLLAEHLFYHALSNQTVITADEWKRIFKNAGLKVRKEAIFDFIGQAYFLLEPI